MLTYWSCDILHDLTFPFTHIALWFKKFPSFEPFGILQDVLHNFSPIWGTRLLCVLDLKSTTQRRQHRWNRFNILLSQKLQNSAKLWRSHLWTKKGILGKEHEVWLKSFQTIFVYILNLLKWSPYRRHYMYVFRPDRVSNTMHRYEGCGHCWPLFLWFVM